MRIAVPVANGRLSAHFGHCDTFALLDVDPNGKAILSRCDETPPPHEPGVLPRWLAELKVNVIIAGGMGSRARSLFESNGIEVVVGAPEDDPTSLVESYLRGSLASSGNSCDH
jgi:ATP-binding protein involved in chromosome partitioning